jgi:peptidyl-prolyl cis-trans isomerase D
MTMLDRMRRHKNWLKWSLFIVVVAFILLYIPNFLRNPGGVGAGDVIASVEGHDITMSRFRRVYQQQIQAYRRAYGGNMDEKLLRQLGIDQRLMQQMIEEEAGLIEADRLGIGASDAEVRARILAMPAFQENGRFIGDERYRQILQSAETPMRPSDFEDQIRRAIVLGKLQSALTDWVTISDAEVTAEFKRRNEKVKLAYVSFPADKFREGVTATDAEIAAQYDQHKDEYRIPDKRKVRYALVDMQGMRDRTTISPQDVQRYYEDNEQQYSTPEQVRASHILLKTEGKDDAAVKKQAEDLLAKVKAGGDFAELATKFSEDEGSAKKGGDLDFFGKGQMVPEFEKTAFALQPGQISDLVKTQYGYHIIKVTDKKAAAKRSLEEVRAQIEDQLKWERAQTQAQRLADDVGPKLKKPGDLDTVAKGQGLVVSESGFFSREEPITGLGMAPSVAARAFEMKDGEVSEAIRTPQGFAFITVTGRQEAHTPTLEEVKARVREDVLKKKALDAARAKAASVAPQLKSGDFSAAAKSAGLEAKTSELIARGTPIGELGASAAIDAAAFSLPVGGVSDPIVTDNGAAIVKVVEKSGATDEELAKGRDALRTEMLNERRNRFFGAYMAKARERMKIEINREALGQLTT